MSSKTSIAACLKHFAGYGAAEGGRDYNSTIPLYLMHNVYLPPFKSAVEVGTQTVMTSFNDNDGIPASANKYLLNKVLREDWGFDGFIVSDWASVQEMVTHGYAKDKKEATCPDKIRDLGETPLEEYKLQWEIPLFTSTWVKSPYSRLDSDCHTAPSNIQIINYPPKK